MTRARHLEVVLRPHLDPVLYEKEEVVSADTSFSIDDFRMVRSVGCGTEEGSLYRRIFPNYDR